MVGDGPLVGSGVEIAEIVTGGELMPGGGPMVSSVGFGKMLAVTEKVAVETSESVMLIL